MYISSNKLNSFNCVEIIHEQEKHQSLTSRLKSPEQPTDVAENQLMMVHSKTEFCSLLVLVCYRGMLESSLCLRVSVSLCACCHKKQTWSFGIVLCKHPELEPCIFLKTCHCLCNAEFLKHHQPIHKHTKTSKIANNIAAQFATKTGEQQQQQ
jgi:hypothetical protein